MLRTRHWDRATIDGLELEYTLRGSGDPVVLIHTGVCANFFAPLAEEPALADQHRVLLPLSPCWLRGQPRLDGPVSIAEQAAHCRSLMSDLGIGKAHIVGYSSSAMMALQLALDTSSVVQSLALLDAARPAPPSEVQRAFVETVVRPALQQYQAGDKAGAVDIWMQGTCGPTTDWCWTGCCQVPLLRPWPTRTRFSAGAPRGASVVVHRGGGPPRHAAGPAGSWRAEPAHVPRAPRPVARMATSHRVFFVLPAATYLLQVGETRAAWPRRLRTSSPGTRSRPQPDQ